MIKDIQRRHAEVFRLRLGDKASNGAPRKLTDSIRVTAPSEAVVRAFTDVYGGDVKPWAGGEGPQFEAYLPTTELAIMVLPGQSIVQWWEFYRGSVCERRCDGEIETLSGKACSCPGEVSVRMGTKDACRPMTRVNVICPDVEVVGAGGLVSHGLIAAETLPQSIAVAEAALARGCMVPAVLRVVEHRGKKHFVVPQIEIVGVSLLTLATGEVGARAIEQPTVAALAPAPARLEPRQQIPAGMPLLPGEEDTQAAGSPAPAAADPEVLEELATLLATLDDDERAAVKEWWKAAGLPPLKLLGRSGAAEAYGEVFRLISLRPDETPSAPSAGDGQDQAEGTGAAAPVPVPDAGPGEPDWEKAKRGLFAAARDAWPSLSKPELDLYRHVLVHACTDGATDSVADCTLDQLRNVTRWLRDIKEGRARMADATDADAWQYEGLTVRVDEPETEEVPK